MSRIKTQPILLVMLIVGLSQSLVLAADTTTLQTDVFVSGKNGYHTFRIPALVMTNKGTLLAFCEGRKTSRADHGDVDIVLRRSDDQGDTWSDVLLVHEEGGDSKVTVGNPCPVVDRTTGVVWLPFTRDNDDVLLTSSADDGRTWSAPQVITDQVKRPDWNWYATGPGNGIQLVHGEHKGRLVIPCDHRVVGAGSRGESTRSHVFFSDDHGKSWNLGGPTDWKMNECAVVELINGDLMLNMRSNRGKGRRGVAISQDGGLTWGECRDDPTLIEPVCQASLIRLSWPIRNKPGRLLFSNPGTKTGRKQLTIRLSVDDGVTWSKQRLLYEGSAAYSSLAALAEDRIGVLYERDDYAKITFARLNLNWFAGEE